MKLPGKWERAILPVLVLGIGLLAALPLWRAGFLNTRIVGESPYLLMRVHQLYSSLREGIFPVRWMPDGAYGYGYPFFSFYAALPYYAAAGFHFLGADIITSLKLTQTLGFLLGASGAYLWTRRHFRFQSASIAAAALFTFAPMHMVNVYVRGDSLSEFWAMAMYPALLWAVDRVIDNPRKGQIALLALCYAGLMLSHNISALIFSPLLGLYIVWRMRIRLRDGRRWGSLLGGLLLGLGLSIWFWLPALVERSTLQMTDFLTGFFDWRNNFLVKGLVQPGLIFDYGTDPFRLGLWQIAIVVLGAVGLSVLLARRIALRRQSSLTPNPSPRWRGERSGPDIGLWAAIIFGICVIMTLSVSSWAYEHLPLLAYLQFPWRWLSIGALGGAAVGAYAIEIWRQKVIRLIAVGALVGLTAFTALIGLHPNFIPLTDADITPARLNEAEYYSGDIGTTVRADYLPIAVHPRPFSGPAILNLRPLKVIDGEATGGMTGSGAVWQMWRVQITTDQAVVAIPTFYWPGWTAALEDGTPLPISGIDGLGWIQVSAPKGEHTIAFQLRETPIRFIADSLAGMAALLWLALVVKGLTRFRPGKSDLYIWLAVAIIFLLLAVVVEPSVDSSFGSSSPQATQFLTVSYRHRFDPIQFQNGSALSLLQYSNREVPAGGTLQLKLTRYPSTLAHVELIPPMVNIWGYDAALVAKTIRAGEDSVSIEIPASAAPGLYFVRLSVGDEAYELTPVRILPPERLDQSTTVSPGLEDARFGDVLRLLDVSTAAIDRERLNIYLKWNVLRPITHTYGLSVRFRSPAGIELGKSDAQLGVYGAVPPAFWPTIFTDWLSLPGLDGLPPGEGYQMTIALFDGDRLVGQTEIRNITVRNSPQQAISEVPASVEGVIALQKTEVEQGADLPILCQWRGPVQDGWRVHWLISSKKDSWEATTPLAPGARLDWWQPDQRYRAVTPLTIPVDLPAGNYVVRWKILNAAGADVSPLATAGNIQITPTSRLFAPPASPTMLPNPPIYGNMIQLWGVQMYQKDDQLNFQIVWKAAAKPDRDYTYFIHVQRIDAPTPAAQTDTMPRQNSYPTLTWLPNEYISDEATVSLAGLAPGTYNVWIGWYDPATGKRLPLNSGEADGRYLIGQISLS